MSDLDSIRCKTCKHWDKDEDKFNRNPFTVGQCKITVNDFEDMFEYGPKDVKGAVAVDGSGYFAALLTAEEFGCLRHEVKS
jgi:hypothetical protein